MGGAGPGEPRPGRWTSEATSPGAFDLAERPFYVLRAIGEAGQDDLLASPWFGTTQVDRFLQGQPSAA